MAHPRLPGTGPTDRQQALRELDAPRPAAREPGGAGHGWAGAVRGRGRVSGMDDVDPVVLDEHRGMAAQTATELRRLRAEVEAQRAALRRRQAELERHFLAGPSASWEEAAEKARYLIGLLADTPEGRDPRRRKVIASVLDGFTRLSG